MNIIRKLRYPLILISETILKYIIRKLFFKNLAKNDFKSLLSYILDLLPHETFLNIVKLLINTFKSKPDELTNLKIINEAITHTIPSDQRIDVIKRAKYLFIILILGNILKRSLFLVKNIILLPFKLGVYSFIASLFGIRPDYLLSFFEIFIFNLPSWTYNKLIELHLSWLNWLKNTLKIESISTDFSNKLSLPKPKAESLMIETVSESKPETYLYLTKTQWFYVSISIIGILAAYFGYTGGIPFTKSFDWESGTDTDSDAGEARNTAIRNIRNRELDKKLERDLAGIRRATGQGNYDSDVTWKESITNLTSKIINKINPFNWWTTNPTIEPKGLPDTWLNASATEREDMRHYEQYRRKFGIPIERPRTGSRTWNYLVNWWNNSSDTDLLRREQLDRHGSLNPIEREQIRDDFVSGKLVSDIKKTSPTHPDPVLAKDYDHLFPKPDALDIQTKTAKELIEIKDNTNQESNPANTSTSPISSRRKAVPPLSDIKDNSSSFIPVIGDNTTQESTSANTSTASILKRRRPLLEDETPSGGNYLLSRKNIRTYPPIDTASVFSSESDSDSTDTITPINQNKNNVLPDGNIITDITAASELKPLINPDSPEGSIDHPHSYPPKPRGKETTTTYFPGQGQPIIRGFQENLNNQFNQPIKRDPKVGILGLSANFLDNWSKK